MKEYDTMDDLLKENQSLRIANVQLHQVNGFIDMRYKQTLLELEKLQCLLEHGLGTLN